jgi:L-iditol 2-dehydrogenase
MQQVILAKPGKIEIRDVPEPEPGEGEIVVKINTALTCGTDLKAYVRGHSLIPMPGPFGHEYSGTVAKTGTGVKDFKEGDDVMGVHSAPCQACRYCDKGIYNLCESIMEKKALGSFAEYMLLPSDIVRQNLFLKPGSLSFASAALLEPLSCVVHSYSRIKMDSIETALIIGAGPIGLLHLAYLKTKGIKVMVSDFFDNRMHLASHMGADASFAPDDVQESLNRETDRLGADLVIECTGQVNVWENTVNYIRRGGILILFGGCPADSAVTYDPHRLHYDEVTLMGSFHYTPADVRTARAILTEESINVKMIISGEFPLQEIEKAFALLQEGRGIKYAVKP